MTGDARQEILARIRRANGDVVAEPIGAHPIPARAQGTATELRERFVAMAVEAAATVDEIPSLDDAPRAVASFLDREGLTRTITLAPDPALRSIPWAREIDVDGEPVEASGAVAVTTAFAGIAETGTLMVHAGPESPNRYHFLPETHVAMLAAEAIVGGYEDAWARLVQRFETLPRSVTLITGPSRSSDIERQLQIGVHGPRRLHIVLCDGQGR
jgi:L-lactate dehydrogenase complex protein LldG